jgi:hypothetical protein
MTDSPKFYYRDAKIHGIPFQKYPETHVFLGKYIAMDGTERERWAHFDPDHCTFMRYSRMVSSMLARRNPRELRGVLRRYAVRYWMWAMQVPRWRVYKQECRLEVLKYAMKLLEKHVITGRFRAQDAGHTMGWLLTKAKQKVIWNCDTTELPLE